MPIQNQPPRNSRYALTAVLLLAGVVAIRWVSLGQDWSFGRNLLPLQCSAFLVLLQSPKRVSRMTIAVTLLAAAYFLREAAPNP